jgi:hypothetical protein
MKSISSAIVTLAGAVLVAASSFSGNNNVQLTVGVAGIFIGGLGFVMWSNYLFRER